jgi:hypothetical protein
VRRLALIALAPVLAAVVLVATGAFGVGSGETPAAASGTASGTATGPGTTTAPPAPGALVLGGRAGELAVGLAVQVEADALAVEARVLSPDGLGAEDLELEFASGTAVAPATPCGAARYCATLASAVPGELDVRILGPGRPGTARFALPASWTPAGELLARATRVYGELQTVVYDERLDPGRGKVLETRWRVAAPDRLAYRIAGGPSAVVVGGERWDREPGGAWIESPQDPLSLPSPPWTDAVTTASLLGSETIRGREASVVSFLDEAGLPTWFTIWIEKATGRTLEVQMTTAGHFMRQHYRSFDEPLRIEPPT